MRISRATLAPMVHPTLGNLSNTELIAMSEDLREKLTARLRLNVSESVPQTHKA